MKNFPLWLCYHFLFFFSLCLALLGSFSKGTWNWRATEPVEQLLYLQAQFSACWDDHGCRSCFGGAPDKGNIPFTDAIIRCLSPSVNPHNSVKHGLVAMYKLAHSITCTKCHMNCGSTGFLSLALFPTGLLIVKLTGAVLIIFFSMRGKAELQ